MTSDSWTVAYADSTSLIALAHIDRLTLMRVVADEVRVTRAVWEEVTGDQTKPGYGEILRARSEGLLLVVDEGDLIAYAPLGRGESSVLSAAAAAGASAIIDERQARRVREADIVLRNAIPQCIGVLGILAKAKEAGEVDAVGPLLNRLIAEGFRISRALYRSVLDAAGE